jgi:uncharacterized protein
VGLAAAVRAAALPGREALLEALESTVIPPRSSGARNADDVDSRSAVVSMVATTIRVKVKPNARASSLVQLSDGTWLAKVKAPAIEGKANKELVALLASRFHCPRAAVFIKSGTFARTKLVRIET